MTTELKTTIVRAQELSPGLTLVTYSVTGITEQVSRQPEGPPVFGQRWPVVSVSSWSGNAIVGTVGAGLLGKSERPRVMTAEALRSAIFAAEVDRRKTKQDGDQ